jgi:dCTP deaminase
VKSAVPSGCVLFVKKNVCLASHGIYRSSYELYSMTILSGQSIRKLRIIRPFHERTKAFGMTYGLGPAGYDVRCVQEMKLKSGQFLLASTIEYFVMPTNLVGLVKDKSTWARLGVAVQNTVIEPGWRGYLTLELTNHSPHDRHIFAGSPIAQILFELMDEPAENPYNGKFQDQPNKPVSAILEE